MNSFNDDILLEHGEQTHVKATTANLATCFKSPYIQL